MPGYAVQESFEFERIDLIEEKPDNNPCEDSEHPREITCKSSRTRPPLHQTTKQLGTSEKLKKYCHSRITPVSGLIITITVGLLLLLVLVGFIVYQTTTKNPEKDDDKGTTPIKKAGRTIKVLKRFVTYLNNSELLFASVSHQDLEGVKVLVQLGSNLNGRNEKEETPLTRATVLTKDNHEMALQIMKFLIEHGANASAVDNSGKTFIHKLVQDPLEGAALTPLEFNEMAEYLIARNLSDLFNAQENEFNVTPLMLAVKSVEVETSTFLLLHETTVNFTLIDKHGNSLFYYALDGKRSTRLLSDLTTCGVDWKELNSYNHSLLHIAAHLCYVEGLKYFLNLGLDINALDSYGSTPLHQVAFYGQEGALETARFLVENGANTEIRDISGSTPLDYALIRGPDLVKKDELVKLLQED